MLAWPKSPILRGLALRSVNSYWYPFRYPAVLSLVTLGRKQKIQVGHITLTWTTVSNEDMQFLHKTRPIQWNLRIKGMHPTRFLSGWPFQCPDLAVWADLMTASNRSMYSSDPVTRAENWAYRPYIWSGTLQGSYRPHCRVVLKKCVNEGFEVYWCDSRPW